MGDVRPQKLTIWIVVDVESHFSQRSLDQRFLNSLAASEHDRRNRLEVKTRNPGKRRFKKERKKKEEKEKRTVPKNALFAIRILSRTQF